jgi:hypothetical protein
MNGVVSLLLRKQASNERQTGRFRPRLGWLQGLQYLQTRNKARNVGAQVDVRHLHKQKISLAVIACFRQMAFFRMELFMPFIVTNECHFNDLV